jgi:membrane fusion protein, multidrug efflux system
VAKLETKSAAPTATNTKPNDKEKSPSVGDSEKKSAQLKVATFLVKPSVFAETVSSTGTLRADEGVELQAESSGKVVSINFEEGRSVKKGTLLVKLNDADLKANLDRYTYTKELAVLRERRYATLLQQKVVTQNDYDTALNDVQVQQALIDLYQAQIVKTEIRAPFDGVVGLRYVSVGAYINVSGNTSTRIATLQRLDKLKIDFAVPEKYAGRIQLGSAVTFSVAGGEKKFAGQIYAIDPRIDSGTRTLLLRAVCPNSDGRLLPGAFANVLVTMEELPNALLVPSEAVIPGLDEKNVFVIEDGKAQRRVVETGSRTATMVHVLAGLKVGDVVITSGLQQMRHGQDVAPLESSQRRSPTVESEPKSSASEKHVKNKKVASNITIGSERYALRVSSI